MAIMQFGPLDNSIEDVYSATLKPGIKSRQELFDELSLQLKFPSYFGNNWDALAECLQDLNWIDKKKVAIIHQDIPKLEETTLRIYIDLLLNCMKEWQVDDVHILTVVFPSNTQTRIGNIISNINSVK